MWARSLVQNCLDFRKVWAGEEGGVRALDLKAIESLGDALRIRNAASLFLETFVRLLTHT